MKIDWVRKLTSRKFWVAVTALATSTMLIFGMAESDVSQIAGIIMQAATVLGYLLAEGLTDAANTKAVETKEEG
jgi:hypothetical protein